MHRQLEKLFGAIFGIGTLVAFLGGLIIAGTLTYGAIVGGKPGSDIMVYTRQTIADLLMKTMTIAVFCGLISLYFKGKHEMTMAMDDTEKSEGKSSK